MMSNQDERQTDSTSHVGNTLDDFNSDPFIGRLTDNERLCIVGHDEVSVTVPAENRALYAGTEESVDSENLPSKDIYVADNNETKNAVTYQAKDTCRKEASGNAYECGEDVDDVPENSDATNTDIDGVQPENVLEDDDESAHHSDVNVWPSISPYAVAYSQYGLTTTNRSDQRSLPDDILQPYAVVHEEQDDPDADQTSTSRRRSVNNAQGVSTNTEFPNTSSDVDGDRKEGLRPNPMYVPNVPQPMAAGGRTFNLSWAQIACIGTIHLVVGALIVTAVTFPQIFKATDQHEDTDMETTSPHPVTEEVIMAIQSTTPSGTHPGENMSSTPFSSTFAGVGNKESEPMKIVFGGTGKVPGKFCGANGVVVSPSNEIFVTDALNRRVQVFNMEGAFLRQFATVVSVNELESEWRMEPECIAIDANYHLWVVGKTGSSYTYVVQYTKTGHRVRTIHPSFPNNTFHGIAVNAPRNHVIVAENWKDYVTIKVLLFDGTVVRTFGKFDGSMPTRLATDTHGNILVSDWKHGGVHVYNETGQYLFSIGEARLRRQADLRNWRILGAGGFGGGGMMSRGRRINCERKLPGPLTSSVPRVVGGVCVDCSEQVILGYAYGDDRRVQLYTDRGEYVRSIDANLTSAESVAVGPDGQLVVVSWNDGIVVVLSHY